MSQKFFQTDKFKILNKEWRKKLKASGFKDIETEKDIVNNRIRRPVGTIQFDDNKDYDKIREIVFEFERKFEGDSTLGGLYIDRADKIILDYFTEGKSERTIEKLLRIEKNINPMIEIKTIKRSQINTRLKRMRKIISDEYLGVR